MEFRIKSAQIAKIRLYGSAKESTQCLLVFTFLDYMMAFYDFKFEINIKHFALIKKLENLKKNPN